MYVVSLDIGLESVLRTLITRNLSSSTVRSFRRQKLLTKMLVEVLRARFNTSMLYRLSQ